MNPIKSAFYSVFLLVVGFFLTPLVVSELLTYKNYDDITEDRAILIRFVTNWCEGCEETQSDWDALTKEWESHPVGLVAEVRCDTEDGEPICDGYQVAGFPSVYYGDPASPEIYAGKLDFESLSNFAKEHITTLPCSLKNLDACDGATKKMIQKFQGKTQEELEKMEKVVMDKVGEEQTKFDKTALEMQKKYEELAKAFNAKIDKLRGESGFKWIQQVLNEMDKENKRYGEEDETEKDEL